MNKVNTPPMPLPKPSVLRPAVTFGFGGAVAMWIVAFLTHLPGLATPPIAVGFLLIATLLGTGFLTGRRTAGVSALLVGAATGAVASIVNLLVLGGLLVEQTGNPNDFRANAPLMVAGWVGGCTVVLAAAAAAGRATAPPREASSDRRWLAAFAKVAVGATFFLLLVGGAVTSAEAGMAAPDWPTTMGANMFLFPLSKMTGGLFYEHAHRLFGALVGLIVMTMMAWTLLSRLPRATKVFSVVLFVYVCVQGVLGGVRVIGDQRLLALVHGVTGQIFIGLLGAFAAGVSLRWLEGPGPLFSKQAGSMRGLAWAFAVVLLLQIALGAVLRHFHKDGTPSMHAAITHAAFSVVALTLGVVAAMRMKRLPVEDRLPRRIGASLTHTLGLQMALGVAALWAVFAYKDSDPAVELILATAHQSVGAVLVILAALCVAWSRRLIAPPDALRVC